MAAAENGPAGGPGRFLQPAPERARVDAKLLERYHAGDATAREQVIARFLPLARQLARRYRRRGDPLDDLFQVASMGLLKAIDRYDPARGTAFSTFAVPTIVGELKRYFRDSGWAVHVPRPVQERVLQTNRAVATLSRDLGRSPAPAEVAAAIGVSVEEVFEAMEAATAFEAVSLETPQSDDDAATYADSIGTTDRGYERVEQVATMEPTMAAMPPRDRLILRLRFERDMTQSEIAVRVGISQMHVSRIISRSLRRLRTIAEAA